MSARHEWFPDVIAAAEKVWRNGGAHDLRGLYDVLGCIPTSTIADVAAITWNRLYWSGHAPDGVRPSRGHSYRVDLGGIEMVARIPDCRDHREGIILSEVSR